MTKEQIEKLWCVYYDFEDKSHGIYSLKRWLKDDAECYLKERAPSCVILDIAETEGAAAERLKDFTGKSCGGTS